MINISVVSLKHIRKCEQMYTNILKKEILGLLYDGNPLGKKMDALDKEKLDEIYESMGKKMDTDGLLLGDIDITKLNRKNFEKIKEYNSLLNLEERIEDKLSLKDVENIYEYCVQYTYTPAERERIINYCKKLQKEHEFEIRLTSCYDSKKWNFCSVKKAIPNGAVYCKDSEKDIKNFKMPISAAIKILNDAYIPFYYENV